jgi:hypothetical protein
MADARGKLVRWSSRTLSPVLIRWRRMLLASLRLIARVVARQPVTSDHTRGPSLRIEKTCRGAAVRWSARLAVVIGFGFLFKDWWLNAAVVYAAPSFCWRDCFLVFFAVHHSQSPVSWRARYSPHPHMPP